MFEQQIIVKPFTLLVKERINGIFAWIDNTSFGQFVRQRSQSFVAINSSIADIGYIMYAFTADETMSALLIAGMCCKISGGIILLADDRKGAAASKENRWPSKVVLFLHQTAKSITLPVYALLPQHLKNILPNAFTGALTLYAFHGMTYFVNGCEAFIRHPSWMDFSQAASGVTMTLGGLSFAYSGFDKNAGKHEVVWSRRGQYFYAITPVFRLLNLITSIVSGQIGRALALTIVTLVGIFQIYVRHSFKRQRNT